MQIKVGSWAGGDPSNPQGTIEWAGGPVDYSAGPFTMYLKSMSVADYSTGSSYSYSGTAGTWQSIDSNGGQINGQGGSSGTSSASSAAPAVTSSVSNTAPLAFEPAESSSTSATKSGWPWDGTATVGVATATNSVYTAVSGLPSGWTVSSSGKVIPPSSGAVSPYSRAPVHLLPSILTV